MDLQATATAMLQKYGAPLTARNLSMAMQELQSNPASEGAALGLQGGASESGYDSSVFKSRLDKLASDGQPNNVSVGLPTGQPLPQAPLPENMEPRGTSAPSSPASVAAAPIKAAGIDNTGGTTGPNPNVPASVPPNPVNSALDKVANDTARPPPPVASGGNSILNYTIDPTKQIPDEAIYAAGSLAAAAPLWAKIKNDKAAISGLSPQMSAADVAMPTPAPRAMNSIDELYPKGQGPDRKAQLQAEIDAENEVLKSKETAPSKTPNLDKIRSGQNEMSANEEGRRNLTEAQKKFQNRLKSVKPRL